MISHPVGFSDPNHPQVGPNFPDVYRLAGHRDHPVFPPRPGHQDHNSWVIPAYDAGPDSEIGHLEEELEGG